MPDKIQQRIVGGQRRAKEFGLASDGKGLEREVQQMAAEILGSQNAQYQRALARVDLRVKRIERKLERAEARYKRLAQRYEGLRRTVADDFLKEVPPCARSGTDRLTHSAASRPAR